MALRITASSIPQTTGPDSLRTPVPRNLRVTASDVAAPATERQPAVLGLGIPEPSATERYLTSPFGRGIDRFQGLAALAMGDPEEWEAQQKEAASGAQLTREDQDIMRQIAETDSAWEALKLYASNPRLVVALASESMGLFGPTLAATAVAAPFSGGASIPAAIVGLGSGVTEYLATIEQKAMEAGATDAASMDRLLENEEFMASAREAGLKRGIPIAALDALSVGLGGKLFVASKGAGRITRGLAATGELGAQSVYGGTGEALAQLAEYGRITAPGEIVSEAVGELGTGPVEIGLAMLARRQPASVLPKPEDLARQEGAAMADAAQQAAPAQPPTAVPSAAPADELIDRLGLEGETQYAPGGLPNVRDLPQAQQDTIAQMQEALPVDEEPTTNLPAEVDPVRAAAEVEPALPAEQGQTLPAEVKPETTEDKLLAWQQAQPRTEDGRRQAPMYAAETSGSKITPNVQLKRDVIELTKDMKKADLLKDGQVQEVDTNEKNLAVLARTIDGLANVLEQQGKQHIANALRRALDDHDAKLTHDIITAARAAVSNADIKLEALGTELEPVISQYRWSRYEADSIYGGGYKGQDLGARRAAMVSFYRGLKALFEEKAGVKIGDDNKKLSATAVAKRLKRQDATYLQDVGKTLADATSVIYGSKDASAKALRRLYKEFDKAGRALEKHYTPRQAAFDERKQEMAERRAEKKALVPATEPPVPAEIEQKRSEPKFVDKEQWQAKNVAIAEDFALQNAMEQGGSYINNAAATGTDKELRAGRKPTKEVTEPSKAKSAKTKWKKQGPQERLSGTIPGAPSKAEQQARTEERASRPTPKGMPEIDRKKVAAEAQARAEEERAKAAARQKPPEETKYRAEVKQTKYRAMRPLLAALRLGKYGRYAKLGGRGLVSDLEFFRGMLAGELKEISPEATLTGRFIESLAAREDGRLLMEEFNSIIDAYVNAPIAEEEVPVVKGGIVYPGRKRQVGYRPAGEVPAPAQRIERQLEAFVERYARNYKTVRPAVKKYAQSLRTLQNRGFEQGTIILESNPVFSQRGVDEAVGRAAAGFKWGDVSGTQQALARIVDALPEGHALRALATALQRTGINVPITVTQYGTGQLGDRNGIFIYDIPAGERNIYIADDLTKGAAVRVILHEIVHAAVVLGYRTDPKIRAFIDNLYAQAVVEAQRQGYAHPGLKNVDEFMAEGFTDAAFAEFLDTTPTSLWDRFVRFVKNLFGVEHELSETVLSQLMKAQPRLFATETQVQNLMDYAAQHVQGSKVVLPSERGAAALKQADSFAHRMAEKIRTAAQTSNWGFMDLNFMEFATRKLFKAATEAAGVEGSPMTKIKQAVTATTTVARELQVMFQQVAELMEPLSNESRIRLGEAMEQITRARLNPEPLDTSNNPDYKDQPWLLESATGEPIHADLLHAAEQAYLNLSEQERTALKALRNITAEARNRRRYALLYHALERRFPTLDHETLELLASAPDAAEFAALVDDNVAVTKDINPDQVKLLANDVFAEGEIEGTYFPLRRKGNWVVQILDDNPQDAYFAAFDTEYEANQHKEMLIARGEPAEDINVTPFITKNGQSTALLDAARALANRVQKDALIKNKDDTLDADTVERVNDALIRAMAEVLSDRMLSSAQMKRENVPGAQPLQMLSNVEDYVRASISAVSMLETANTYDQALADMGSMQKHPNVDADSRRTIAQVRNEILLRAAEISNDRDVVATDRILGGIGFYNYLGAPSYWMLNATQTAVVGVPVMAGLAKVSYFQAMHSMKRAYKQLHEATKGLGWKALDDLDAVVARLPDAQRQVVEQLIKDNVIQGTLAHEFNVLAKGSNSTYSKVTSMLTVMPEMIERWNRISMALAAMDAGIDATTNEGYTSIRDIVETSQFNYDPANRARLLKYAPKLLGGGARRFIAPMMMFKVFGVNMARLVYGNLYKAMFDGRLSKEERMQSAKIFLGLIGSHTAFGGVFGGLGLGLAQTIEATINAMLDDDDEIDVSRALEDFLIEHTNEYVARIVTRGAPAAIGVDMSSSINLGNLLFMNRDTDWSKYGGVEQSAYALLGPVAQYVAGATREGAQLMDGEASVADFLEKAVPLKMYRALSQSFRYGMEGLETGQGQQFLSPDELNVGALTLTALGLRSAKVAQRQERFYADRTLNRTLETKKSTLLREAATASTPAERRRTQEEVREWNALMRKKRNYSLIIQSSSIQRSRTTRREVDERYRRGEFTEYNR